MKSEELLNYKMENSSLNEKIKNLNDKLPSNPDILLKKNLVSLERNME